MPEETFLEYCDKLDETEHFVKQVIMEKDTQVTIISASAFKDKGLLTVISNNDLQPETFFAEGVDEIKDALERVVAMATNEGFSERNKT